MFAFNVLKIYRRAAGISLKQLSELTYYSISYLSELERGLAMPPIETIVKICNVLGIRLSSLFDDNNRIVAFVDEIEILNLIKRDFGKKDTKELKNNLVKVSTWTPTGISNLNSYIVLHHEENKSQKYS